MEEGPRSMGAELLRVLPMAVAAVALGITTQFLVATRPVEPLEPPIPVVDGTPLAKIARDDREASRRLDATPPPIEIRALGSAYLEWNVAAAATPAVGGPSTAAKRTALQQEIRSAMGVARRTLGDDATWSALRDLRSHHTELFFRELERARDVGPTDEYRRLTGALDDVLRKNGWLGPSGEIHVPPAMLRARYKLHWTSIVFTLEDCDRTSPPICFGLTTLPLPTDELRALLAFLVAYPVVRPEDEALAGSLHGAIDRRRLVYLDRLLALDEFADPTRTKRPYLGDYPIDLARGAMLYRLGSYTDAAELLRRAATEHPDDMRARNWLLAAIQKAQGD
jgi:hypothetical protein